jgi:hypothetical protein
MRPSLLVALGGRLKPSPEARVDLTAVLDRGELGMAIRRSFDGRLEAQHRRMAFGPKAVRGFEISPGSKFVTE